MTVLHVVAVLLLAGVYLFVVPRFAALFSDLDLRLPLPARAILQLSALPRIIVMLTVAGIALSVGWCFLWYRLCGRRVRVGWAAPVPTLLVLAAFLSLVPLGSSVRSTVVRLNKVEAAEPRDEGALRQSRREVRESTHSRFVPPEDGTKVVPGAEDVVSGRQLTYRFAGIVSAEGRMLTPDEFKELEATRYIGCAAPGSDLEIAADRFLETAANVNVTTRKQMFEVIDMDDFIRNYGNGESAVREHHDKLPRIMQAMLSESTGEPDPRFIDYLQTAHIDKQSKYTEQALLLLEMLGIEQEERE